MKKNHHRGKTIKDAYEIGSGASASDFIADIQEDLVLVLVQQEDDGWWSLDQETTDSSIDVRIERKLKEAGLRYDFYHGEHATKTDALAEAKWWARWMIEECVSYGAEVYDVERKKIVASYEATFYVKATKAT